MNMTTVTSHNLYEGAYYLKNGAEIKQIKSRYLREKKVEKKGFRTQYFVTFSLPVNLVNNIQLDKATMKVSELEYWRKKLKKMVKAYFEEVKQDEEFHYEPRRQY